MKLNITEIIKEDEKKLARETEEKEIRFLKRKIKADRSFIRLLKYLGSQFGFMEKIWITGVIISFSLTFIGVLMIFIVII